MPPSPARCRPIVVALRSPQRPLRRHLRNRQRDGAAPTRLRFTGTAVETVEAAVLTRSIERGEIVKSSDVSVERRPKAEVGNDVAARDRAIGMQAPQAAARRPGRCEAADLAKPDLVQRDQSVTLIYETAGIYLTIRGKALESGTEGDIVSVMNLQSKRTVSGTVTGRGQVDRSRSPRRARASQPRRPRSSPAAAPVALAAADLNRPRKAE